MDRPRDLPIVAATVGVSVRSPTSIFDNSDTDTLAIRASCAWERPRSFRIRARFAPGATSLVALMQSVLPRRGQVTGHAHRPRLAVRPGVQTVCKFSHTHSC